MSFKPRLLLLLLLLSQAMLVSMVDAAEGLCPHVMRRSSLRQELLRTGSGRMTIPRSFVTTTLLEQSGVDIINKIRSDSARVWVTMNFRYSHLYATINF